MRPQDKAQGRNHRLSAKGVPSYGRIINGGPAPDTTYTLTLVGQLPDGIFEEVALTTNDLAPTGDIFGVRTTASTQPDATQVQESKDHTGAVVSGASDATAYGAGSLEMYSIDTEMAPWYVHVVVVGGGTSNVVTIALAAATEQVRIEVNPE